MANANTYFVLLLSVTTAYFMASKLIFDNVYKSQSVVIDELFHIPQGIQYCNHNFSYWDPKITTLPGLYLLSTLVISYFPCNTYNLRFVNLIASCVNFLLFASILKFVYGNNNESHTKIILQAVNLAILPPLYFFSHVYYTDTLSLTFLLAFSRLCFMNRHKLLILLLAAASIMMRQTNVVWIAMVFGHKLLDIFIRSSRVFGNLHVSNAKLSKHTLIAHDTDRSKLKRYYDFTDFLQAVRYHIETCFVTFFKFVTLQDFIIILTHLSVLLSFITFVFINGSIVVGDKTAHMASLHVPQLFYFLLFYGMFGLTYVFSKLKSTLVLLLNNKTKVLLFTVLFLAIVHYNTLVHPYLLADNRHYTFYIWNRWFGKYDYARYATVPVYVILLFSLYDNLKHQNCISFLLPYTVCIFCAVSLQKMIEVRYFLIPYIILRLRFARLSYKMVIFEFIWYMALNVVTFYLFFNKKIMWEDFDYPQRIIW